MQCRLPLSHVARSEICLDLSHFLEEASIHFIHTPSSTAFPMQQGVLAELSAALNLFLLCCSVY